MQRIRLHSPARLALAATLGLALMVTAPTRVQAQNNADGAVAAFLALGLIGLALGAGGQGQVTIEHGQRGYVDDGRYQPGRYTLPSSCLREIGTGRGTERFMGRRCLKRNYAWTNTLPARCEERVRVWTRNGNLRSRDMFRMRCLRQEGYRIGRARD